MSPILLAISAGVTLCLLLAMGATVLLSRPQPGVERLAQLAASVQPDRVPHIRRHRMQNGLSSVVAALRHRFGLRLSAKLQDRLDAAGMRSAHAADVFFAVQWLAPLLGVFLGSFISQNTMFLCVVSGVVGYLAPDLWLSRRIKKRKEKIRRSLPDAMDLLNICVDAGLGLDQAMLRVSDELVLSHPELQDEFHRVHLEQRAGSGRMDAWKRLAARMGIEELSAFVSMLSQTEKFGTPIARALGRFAEELRGKRRQRAEEAAAKTRVKIVFPLVFFIFPCLFIVLLAPAMIGILKILKDLR
jgi:tight adherence protein C